MFNPFDLMRQAQGGAGLENLARHFGLPPAQGHAAVAALLPALTMGLQRAAMDPAAMAQLVELMSRGPYAAFFRSADHGFSPEARQQGDQALEQLFGSAEFSRAVAQQAAAFSGLGLELMRQMMPIVAAMFMGGLRAAFEQGPGVGPAPDRPLQAAPPALPWPWAEFLTAATRSGPPSGPARAPASTPFDAMMSLFMAGLRPAASQAPPPPPTPTPPTPANPVEAWSALMNAGLDLQRQHLEALQSLFDAWCGRKGDER
jgi:hypothetical protein